MKTVKVSELSGAALDWAVAKCEGKSLGYAEYLLSIEELDLVAGVAHSMVQRYRPSANWAQGGPIIEREEITVCWQGATWVGSKFNVRVTDEYEFHQTGTTLLIAAMRCYVASKMGDTVEVPEELL